MLSLESDIEVVLRKRTESFSRNLAATKDEFLRSTVSVVVGMLRERVHVKGQASDGSQIGTYSDAYMRVRTGLYIDSSVVKSGKTAGKLISAGVYTKGKHKGEPRPKYNRSTDRKVVASLTRQMEADMTMIAVDDGYAIGYLNSFNFLKSQYVESTYGKEIWKLDLDQREFIKRESDNYINNVLSR